MSHRTCGSRPPCTRHPIHACAPVCFVVVVFSSPVSVFYFVPPLSFRPFQMFLLRVQREVQVQPLCDFRLGTVATLTHPRDTPHRKRWNTEHPSGVLTWSASVSLDWACCYEGTSNMSTRTNGLSRHMYIRANQLNVEIPEGMSLFTELKTLTGL